MESGCHITEDGDKWKAALSNELKAHPAAAIRGDDGGIACDEESLDSEGAKYLDLDVLDSVGEGGNDETSKNLTESTGYGYDTDLRGVMSKHVEGATGEES